MSDLRRPWHCYMGMALQCRCAVLFFTWAMPWGWACCFLLWGEDNYLMSGFGACQGSTCLCAIRAGLGEPGSGLEQGAPCPTALGSGTGGRPMSEPASAGIPGSPLSWLWLRLLVLVDPEEAGGSLGLPGQQVPAPGSVFGAASVGWFMQASLHTWCSCYGDGHVSLGAWKPNLPCVPEAGAWRRPWARDSRLLRHLGPPRCHGALWAVLEMGWLPSASQASEHPTSRWGPHPAVGQGGMAATIVTCSAVSWHRPAPAGHPLGGGAHQRASPRHEGVPSAGSARFPAHCLAAPCAGLPRLPALHPL